MYKEISIPSIIKDIVTNKIKESMFLENNMHLVSTEHKQINIDMCNNFDNNEDTDLYYNITTDSIVFNTKDNNGNKYNTILYLCLYDISLESFTAAGFKQEGLEILLHILSDLKGISHNILKNDEILKTIYRYDSTEQLTQLISEYIK